jgi:hypothetical protein
MKKGFLLLILITLSFLGAKRLFIALASDERQIAWLLEDMEAGYDAAKVGPCVAGIAEDWRHGSSRELDRDALKGYLLREFLIERDTRTKEFLLRVEVPAESVEIQVDGERATLRCEARFERRTGAGWETTWHIRALAELARAGGRWRIVHSSHENLVGRRP